jgi:NADPH-dependent ferric siderophore reductase
MLQWPDKDPNEVLDYELDWADPDRPRLEAGETLTSSTWSVVTGDVVIDTITHPATYTPQGLATVWLTGGTAGSKCELLNRVNTSKGRTYDQTIVLRMKNH